jgi:hypothetical protein
MLGNGATLMRRYCAFVLSVVTIGYGLARCGLAQDITSNTERLFYVDSISSDGHAVLYEYDYLSQRKVPLSNVEVWAEKVDAQDPMKTIYWAEPDVTLELLRSGYARLKEPEKAPLKYQEAELDAKAGGRGLWDKNDQDSKGKEEAEEDGIDWSRVKATMLQFILLYGGLGAVIAALLGIWGFTLRLLRRRRMPLLFLGLHAVGKTWLWTRIRKPEISHEELNEITRTDATMYDKLTAPEPLGRYELMPIYIDTPGGQPGMQTTEMLKKYWFVRQKSVWMIILSTTPLSEVTRASRDEDKVDREYISEQLGYLALPLGMLAARKTPKPAVIVVVISKFDLFCEFDPSSPDAQQAKDRLRGLFSRHVARMEEECSRVGVKFKVEFCSALRGWRTEILSRHIKDALFSR